MLEELLSRRPPGSFEVELRAGQVEEFPTLGSTRVTLITGDTELA